MIVVDPRTKAIVWQYGRTGVAGAARRAARQAGRPRSPAVGVPPGRGRPSERVAVRRVGTLPFPLTKSAAVALPGGKLIVLGGAGSDRILAGPPSRLRVAGHLVGATHDGSCGTSWPIRAAVRRRRVRFHSAVVRVDSQPTPRTRFIRWTSRSRISALRRRRQHLSRRRLHGNDVRERDPAPRRERPHHDRRAPSQWNALRRRGDERRQDLRRRRPDDARREPRDLRVRSARRNRRPHRVASAPRGARGSGCARRTSVSLRRPVGVAHLA